MWISFMLTLTAFNWWSIGIVFNHALMLLMIKESWVKHCVVVFFLPLCLSLHISCYTVLCELKSIYITVQHFAAERHVSIVKTVGTDHFRKRLKTRLFGRSFPKSSVASTQWLCHLGHYNLKTTTVNDFFTYLLNTLLTCSVLHGAVSGTTVKIRNALPENVVSASYQSSFSSDHCVGSSVLY